MLLAYWRCTVVGTPAWLSKSAHSVARARFGAVCAFLCSLQAGYLTGQNILLDGGAYPGTF